MSTIGSATFNHDSDDENDSDFVPDVNSDSEDEGKERTEPQSKVKTEADVSKQKQNRAALWDSFQASVKAVSSSGEATKASQPRLVKIEKRYKFAGETISEVVEVPEDSDEAKKWPLTGQSPTSNISQDKSEIGREPTNPVAQLEKTTTSEISSPVSNAPSSSDPQPSISSTPAAASKNPASKRPGPRKPKTVLAPLPSQTKAKKISTLEKSAMDWQAHVQSTASPAPESVSAAGTGESIADELERNRRGGGYLERMGFLDRVGERRDELFEDSRSKRRRK